MRKPFIGVAYYPEDWDETQIPIDLIKMKEVGISAIRIGEFAWAKMEPTPGNFQFKWLHHVIDEAGKLGIQTILGTPTACPPIWFFKAHPEAYVVKEDGIHQKHGGRRAVCSNDLNYRSYCASIVRAMAKEFGSDPNVIGWQIDNELEILGCMCETCRTKFHSYLEDKYGSIDVLNKKWNLNLFSQIYDSFDSIPFPDHGWHNPHLKYEYRLFDASSQIEFCHFQRDILREYVKAPIGTDTKPYHRLSYLEIEKGLDIVEINHYHTVETLPQMQLYYDLIRPIKDQPYWTTETATSYNGATTADATIVPYGYCRINTWMSIILGGEATMYWLFRTHHAGHEQMHSALFQADGRPCYNISEVIETSKEFEKCSRFLCTTKVQSEVGFHFLSSSFNLFDTQSILKDFSYPKSIYTYAYAPLIHSGVRPDLLMEDQDLSRYKLLVTSLTPTLETQDLGKRIANWVRDGGVWVVGPLTDCRDFCGARYTHSAYSMLEELLEEKQVYELPDYTEQIQLEWNDGTPLGHHLWMELFEGTHGLAKVKDGYPSLLGLSPILRKPFGKGIVYFIGTFLDEPDMKKIYQMAIKDAGVTAFKTEGELTVAERKGEQQEGMIVGECGGGSGSIILPSPMKDLLSGKTLSGKVSLSPYELLVLIK